MIDLNGSDKTTIAKVLKEHLPEGTQVFAFGSRVTGKAREWSDLDLLFRCEASLPIQQFYGLQDALEESELSIKVDLVDWHRTSPEFLHSIKQELEPLLF